MTYFQSWESGGYLGVVWVLVWYSFLASLIVASVTSVIRTVFSNSSKDRSEYLLTPCLYPDLPASNLTLWASMLSRFDEKMAFLSESCSRLLYPFLYFNLNSSHWASRERAEQAATKVKAKINPLILSSY